MPIQNTEMHDQNVLQTIKDLETLCWLNPHLVAADHTKDLPLNKNDWKKAQLFFDKYTRLVAQIFPETNATNGRISSPLQLINSFRNYRNKHAIHQTEGNFFLKRDDALAVAGSIKARGGFYEVLHYAHQLALQNKLINDDEVIDFSKPIFRKLFAQYTIGVGSTGNLGLSIGIISAKLGFQVNVYMSDDAKEWKKALLRSHGANVVEKEGDFSVAINAGRIETLANPKGYFVDDEKSGKLFLGYSLAAFELQQQLKAKNIIIDAEHPLFVYSPCGVGGSPGGVMWGLKNVFGDAVHCFFVEPTHAPSVVLGLVSGKKEKICVQDVGIDNITEADGLAVGRPSAFASNFIDQLVSGIYTIEDEMLFCLLDELNHEENIFIEPSATAGLIGPETILKTDYCEAHQINPENITHIAWATGGGLMPEITRNQILKHAEACHHFA